MNTVRTSLIELTLPRGLAFTQMLAAVLALLGTGAATAAPVYEVVNWPYMHGSYERYQDINNFNVIVGTTYSPYAGVTRSFVLNNGVPKYFGQEYREVRVELINDNGTMIGRAGSYNTLNSNYNLSLPYGPFVYSGIGSLSSSQFLGSASNGLLSGNLSDINDRGQIIGATGNYLDARAFRTGPGASFNPLTDYLGTLGGPSSGAGEINNYGLTVGASTLPTKRYGSYESHAFAFDTTMHDLGTLGGSSSYATGVNDLGQIVGYSDTRWGPRRAFLHNGIGPMSSTDMLPILGRNDFSTSFYSSYAFDVNNRGEVVGNSQFDESGEDHAFLYKNGEIYDLNDIVLNRSFEINYAHTINDNGWILAQGTFMYGVLQDLILRPVAVTEPATVPEPASIALIAGALIGIVATRRRLRWGAGGIDRCASFRRAPFELEGIRGAQSPLNT